MFLDDFLFFVRDVFLDVKRQERKKTNKNPLNQREQAPFRFNEGFLVDVLLEVEGDPQEVAEAGEDEIRVRIEPVHDVNLLLYLVVLGFFSRLESQPESSKQDLKEQQDKRNHEYLGLFESFFFERQHVPRQNDVDNPQYQRNKTEYRSIDAHDHFFLIFQREKRKKKDAIRIIFFFFYKLNNFIFKLKKKKKKIFFFFL